MIIRKFIFLFLILKIFSSANAEDFIFETKNIEIIDNGNLIIAGKGSVFSNNKDIEIQADKFEYLKENKILNVYGKGIAIIKSKNIVSEFNNAKISRNDNTLSFRNRVKIYHISSGFEAQTKNLTFNNLKNTVS